MHANYSALVLLGTASADLVMVEGSDGSDSCQQGQLTVLPQENSPQRSTKSQSQCPQDTGHGYKC